VRRRRPPARPPLRAPAADRRAAAHAAALLPLRSRPHLPASLFQRLDGASLPYDGRVLTARENSCDPADEVCPAPQYVWEARCARCAGSGATRSLSTGGGRGRGRGSSKRGGSLGTCAACTGLGFVRHVSVDPAAAAGCDGEVFTLGRAAEPPGGGEAPKRVKLKLWTNYDSA
jgi:hypothetical protein